MLLHPDLTLALANQHHRELIAEADRRRLLSSALRALRACRARHASAVRARPTGTLASCEPSAAVPAR
ncbi:hypothetical protein EDD30_1260 [Couchioplanes caeruleus]|uniref:Uncharacterized protein n=2 Tax=Couchioplanes caeruleus TaxID=56438 RepID=A0A1K0FSS5_9ACTN|nr:hypothetical protein BG844_01360 [Couchioplanes caeruleus subsp. caeruleus]ROP28496.1 hypothetical protein EDD30_1260 [Couchioplanes caeruleus]